MKNLSNIKEKLLVEQVEEMLYKLIKEEPYPKGTKLPNEFKLGEHFGVSRSTVREAIRSLTSKGVLEVRRGSGTYVVNTMLPLNESEANTTRILYFRGVVSFVFNWKVFAEH